MLKLFTKTFDNTLIINICLLCFLILPQTLIAQNRLDGFIYAQDNNKVISYVNIGIAAYGIGTVSDRNGYFELKDARIKANTQLTISCIGYETITLAASKIMADKNIYLKPASYNMAVVEITANAVTDQEVQYGVSNGPKRGKSVGFASQQLGTEMGAMLNIKKASYIKSAHFEINHAKGDSVHFRVLLRPYIEGVLQESILPAEVIIHDEQESGTIDIDLSEFNLNLEGKYLLSLQWIQNDGSKENDGLTFDTKKSGKTSGIYAKLFSTGSIDKLPYHPRTKLCFYMKGLLIE